MTRGRATTPQHGTRLMWERGCRCDACVEAKRAYDRKMYKQRSRNLGATSHDLLVEVLQDMFPLGLTDDCPARKALRGETG